MGAKVDWFTVTFRPESSDLHVARELWERCSAWVGGSLVGEECAGRYGYAFGCSLMVASHGSLVSVGRVDWGGDRHGGRARFELSGAGCSVVSDWRPVRAFFESQLEPSITRVDLAVDCLLGEFSVDDAVGWYEGGEFHAGGRRPRHSCVGDWLDPRHGRTFEVGRRENGKMLRAYEKGRQLGDTSSTWTRFEVELRNNDRDLPFDVLTRTDAYFVGAYEALRRLLDVAGERVRTHQAEGEISLGRLLTFQRSSYGQLVEVLRARLSAGEVLDLISRPGVPSRLHRPSLVAFHQLGAGSLVNVECRP